MKTKIVLFRSIALLIGLLLGFVLAESLFRKLWGSPQEDLLKKNTAYPCYYYFYFDCYRDFFRKVKTSAGETLFVSQRNEAARKLFAVVPKETFPLLKSSETRRIFILGESTACFFGDSKNELITVLKKRLPGLNFEVINCGMPGYDILRISQVFKEVMKYSPDLILLFVGNNALVDPDVVMKNPISRFLYEKTWCYRLLDINFLYNHRVHYPPGYSFGMHEKKLMEMVQLSKAQKIPLVLYTLPCNLKAFLRFAFQGPVSTREYFMARIFMDQKRYKEAGNLLKSLTKHGYDKNLNVLMHLALCMEEQSNYQLALKYARYALQEIDFYEGESFFNRHRKNLITRDIARREKLPLVDLEAGFMKMDPHGLPGYDLILDEMHWWQAFNPWIMEETLRTISEYNSGGKEKILSWTGIWNGDMASIQKEARKNARIEYSACAMSRYFDYTMGYLKGESDFIFPDMIIEYLKRVYPVNPALFKDVATFKTQACKMLPDSVESPQQSGIFEEKWPSFLWTIGETLRQLGQYNKALVFFNESIRLKCSSLYPYLLRGLTYYLLKDYGKAKNDWNKVIEKDPAFIWLNEVPGLRP
jgi:tetratricopeptide (TPR) repeat protein